MSHYPEKETLLDVWADVEGVDPVEVYARFQRALNDAFPITKDDDDTDWQSPPQAG